MASGREGRAGEQLEVGESGHEDITSVSVPLSQSLQVWSMGAVAIRELS